MHFSLRICNQAPWGLWPLRLHHSVTSEPEDLIPTWYRLITSFLLPFRSRDIQRHPFLRLVYPFLPIGLTTPFSFFPYFFFPCVASHLIENPIQSRSSVRTRAPDQTHIAGTAQCKAASASLHLSPVQLNLGVLLQLPFLISPPTISPPLQFCQLAVTLLTHKPTWDFPTMERECGAIRRDQAL